MSLSVHIVAAFTHLRAIFLPVCIQGLDLLHPMHLRPTKAYISFHPSLLCLLLCLLLHTFPQHHHNVYMVLLPENTTISNIQDHYAYAAPFQCMALLTPFSMKLHGAGKLFTSAPESTLRYYPLPSGIT